MFSYNVTLVQGRPQGLIVLRAGRRRKWADVLLPQPLQHSEQDFDVGLPAIVTGLLAALEHCVEIQPVAHVANGLRDLGADILGEDIEPLLLDSGKPAAGFFVGNLGQAGRGNKRTVHRRPGPQGRPDEVGGSTVRRGPHLLNILFGQLVQAFQQGADQRLLVGKVVKQPTLRDAGPFGDSVERGSPLPYLYEEGFVGIQDGVPGNWFSWHVYIIP